MLPPYASKELVAERLPLIFPEGIPNRAYCTRDTAVYVIFTMLYIGAIDGTGVCLGPVHVYRMTGLQASEDSAEARIGYRTNLRKKKYIVPGTPLYADNSREGIRDETLNQGFIPLGAVTKREDLPTTSDLPRYALKPELAALFDPNLQGSALDDAILHWQETYLSQNARARVSLMRLGSAGKERVLVQFPNGETRNLSPGPSSIISKAVVEVFAIQFLEQPGVLWLSESGNKVAMRDLALASEIGLNIEAQKTLPDLILVDLGPMAPLIVFVEVVATDGAITALRQEALYEITDKAGFARSQVAFVTAYKDRETAGFKKTMNKLAWGSFAWFLSEPDKIVVLRDGVSQLARLNEQVALSE
ncbi:BsuBI/PstI family type II restriction endonuclease [Pseudomonas peli]|uniref:BsuBI/PstI family type II restriction endonuclease n=1 Tax=Pseudomonas peli TaxID=592361 RepID=UPI002861428A|nr:BsuBI/PstI family type II restriction endonuclease [Pseudomonas peli]MDR7025195.1 hypothetical protein [Pseudomonas peli]